MHVVRVICSAQLTVGLPLPRCRRPDCCLGCEAEAEHSTLSNLQQK